MISSSLITNSCLNGEIWSYKYKSPVRHYGQFVLYCVSWCSPIQTRYALNTNHGLGFLNTGSSKPGTRIN